MYNMRKTEDLFKQYASLLSEAGLELPDETVGNPDATDVTEQPELEPDATEDLTPEGEKYLTELLLKAFLHEPDESDAATAKELQAKLEEDPKAVAAAIGNLVEIGPEGGIKDELAEI